MLGRSGCKVQRAGRGVGSIVLMWIGPGFAVGRKSNTQKPEIEVFVAPLCTVSFHTAIIVEPGSFEANYSLVAS